MLKKLKQTYLPIFFSPMLKVLTSQKKFRMSSFTQQGLKTQSYLHDFTLHSSKTQSRPFFYQTQDVLLYIQNKHLDDISTLKQRFDLISHSNTHLNIYTLCYWITAMLNLISHKIGAVFSCKHAMWWLDSLKLMGIWC